MMKIFISPFKGGSTSIATALEMVGFKRWISSIDNWWLDEFSLISKKESYLISEANKIAERYVEFKQIPKETHREIEISLGDFLTRLFGDYDVADDYPLGHDIIHPFIKKIIFKKAKFIFSERPLDEYVSSVKFHSLNKKYKHIYRPNANHTWGYGYDFFCKSPLWEKITIENYKAWKKNYMALSEEFPGDVLIMDLEDGWDAISSFIGFEKPDVEFPRLNMSELKENPCIACDCKHEIKYCDLYHSKYCPICLEWCDELCGEKKCPICSERPEKPINTKAN